MTESNDLTSGPVSGHLRRQATAFSIGLIAIFSFELVDLFFISKLGDASLAAISFTFPIVWLVYGIGIGFEAGAASVVSRAIGRKEEGFSKRLTTDSVLLATLVLAVVAVLGLMTIEPVFGLLGATPELIPMIREYMSIWYWVAPIDACLWTCLATLRARGNAPLEARLIILAAVINLCLDPILIFGLFGFPRLELMGAALATVISNLVVLAVTLLYLTGRLQVFANPFAPFRDIIKSWKHMLVIGIPAMISNAIIPLSSAIVVAMIASYGVDAVAGFGVAARIEPFALLVFYALSAIASPFFGQNFGARRQDRLVEARRVIMKFCLIYGFALAIILDLIAKPVASIFTDSESIQVVATHYIWLVSWGYGAHGMVMSVNSAFNGTGRPIPAVLISAARVIFLFLPMAFLARWLFGLEGIFISSAICNVVLAVFAYVWLGRHIKHSSLTAPIS